MNAQQKKILAGLAVVGGVMLFAKRRPPLVRGNDPGFDWMGQHVQGGQGSAITNVGAPSSARTDYVLVATAQKNYAANRWGYAAPGVPVLKGGYALRIVDYWYKELGRLLGRTWTSPVVGETWASEPIGGQFQGSWQGTFSPKDWLLILSKSPFSKASFQGVSAGYKNFVAHLPTAVLNAARASVTATGRAMPPGWTDEMMLGLSVPDVQKFWNALLQLGIDVDVSKATPEGTSYWNATMAALKAAANPANVGGKAVDLATQASKSILTKILASPTGAIVLGGIGYLVYRRYVMRSA